MFYTGGGATQWGSGMGDQEGAIRAINTAKQGPVNQIAKPTPAQLKIQKMNIWKLDADMGENVQNLRNVFF